MLGSIEYWDTQSGAMLVKFTVMYWSRSGRLCSCPRAIAWPISWMTEPVYIVESHQPRLIVVSTAPHWAQHEFVSTTLNRICFWAVLHATSSKTMQSDRPSSAILLIAAYTACRRLRTGERSNGSQSVSESERASERERESNKEGASRMKVGRDMCVRVQGSLTHR